MHDSEIRILIADKEEDFRQTVLQTLKHYFHSVDEAHSGPEVLSMCEEHDYSLVIISNHLPGILGIEVVRRLQQKFPHMKRILTSNDDTDPVIESGLEWGVIDRFIQKPIDVGDLIFESEYLLGLCSEPPHLDLADLENAPDKSTETPEKNRTKKPVLRLDVLVEKVNGETNDLDDSIERRSFHQAKDFESHPDPSTYHATPVQEYQFRLPLY